MAYKILRMPAVKSQTGKPSSTIYLEPESVTSWLQHLPDSEYFILSRQRSFFQSIKTQFSS